MRFDELYNKLLDMPGLDEAKRGRPRAKAKLYKPSEKAFDIGYTSDSVEGKILQFLEEKPATMEELVSFLRQNFDEYHSVSTCKEKIREMLLDDVLDFAADNFSNPDDEEIPALDPVDDDEPDLHKYIGGALDDYQRSDGYSRDELSDY